MTNFTGWIKSLFIFIYNILLRNKLWQSFDLALAWIIVIAQLSFVMHVNYDKNVMLVNIVICWKFDEIWINWVWFSFLFSYKHPTFWLDVYLEWDPFGMASFALNPSIILLRCFIWRCIVPVGLYVDVHFACQAKINQ